MKNAPEHFSYNYRALRSMEALEALEQNTDRQIHSNRLKADLLEQLAANPEDIVSFYQNAYLRFRELTLSTKTKSAENTISAIDTIQEANEFFVEFGSTILRLAAQRNSDDLLIATHIATHVPSEHEANEKPHDNDDEVSGDAEIQIITEDQPEEYVPWSVVNTKTLERIKIPDELRTGLLWTMLENDNPMTIEDIVEEIAEWSQYHVITDYVTIKSAIFEWLDVYVASDSGPQLEATGTGRWATYQLVNKPEMMWIDPSKESGAEDAAQLTPSGSLTEDLIIDEEELKLITEIATFAKSGEAFRTEELKRAIPSLLSMDQAGYAQFKSGFAKIREQIAERLLKEEGIESRWETSGKARGTTYRLVVTGHRPKPQPTKSTDPDLSNHNEIPEDPARTAGDDVKRTPTLEEYASDLIKRIKEYPNVSRSELLDELNIEEAVRPNFVQAVFPIIQQKLALEGLELKRKRGKDRERFYTIELSPSAESADSKPDSQTWQKEDIDIAGAIINELVQLKDHKQAKKLKDLAATLIESEIEEADMKRVIRLLAECGVVYLTAKRFKGYGNNTTTQLPVVKFTSKEARRAWKFDRANQIAELKKLIT